MKIRIFVDVFQNYQQANSFVVECGETKNSFYDSTDSKRYEIEVDVPHPSDAIKIESSKIREVI